MCCEGTSHRTIGSQVDHSLSVYISPDGMQKTPAFEGMATIAADLMNVLYAGFDNPITISIPNTAQNDIQASMSGGSLISRGGGKFVARPTSVGNPCNNFGFGKREEK